MLLQRIRGEWLEVDARVLGERILQIGNRGARRGAEQAEGGFRLDVELDLGEAQHLLRGIEHRLAPDVHRRVGAEAEPALLLVRLDAQADQQPVARRRDASRG